MNTTETGPLGVGFADYAMQPGDHLPAFSDTDLQRRRVVVPFVATGLRHRQRVVFLGTELASLAFLEDLRLSGVPVAEHLEGGGLLLLCRPQALRRGGHVDLPTITAVGRRLVQDSVREGWPLVRAVLEVSSLLETREDATRWLSYEALAREDILGIPMLVLAHHDRRRLPEDLTERSLRCHPVCVVSGELRPNPWWHPPRDFLSVAGRPD